MNKRELIKAVSNTTNMPIATVSSILSGITNQIATELNTGGEVVLVGFGKFTTKLREERKGRHPKTGEPIVIAEKTVAVCKLSQLILK